MKGKKVIGRLRLNKVTIADMQKVKGGYEQTWLDPPCDNTQSEWACYTDNGCGTAYDCYELPFVTDLCTGSSWCLTC
jgi:hypothetical protein